MKCCALNYQYDVAYFLDVLLTPERLAGFIAHHPKLENRDVYVYSLGLRYLRNEQWEKARMEFAKVQAVNCNIGSYNWYRNNKPSNPKWGNRPSRANGNVCSEWLLSDLKTTNDLERLAQQISSAQGDEAKAEAMYQFASYQFESSQLLFYNPVIWSGARYSLLCDFDGAGNYRSPNEAKIVYEYMQSHENLAHAIPTYLELARLYPNTRAAKDGLYTAVVAHRRLANYNDYWRRLYQNGLQAGKHRSTFREIRSLYPKYQMPRAEQGWEPMTRTVNGGPGWAPPPPKPKPVPKPTRTQKFKRLLARFWVPFQTDMQRKVDAAEERYAAHLRRCLYAVLAAFGLIGGWYGTVLGLHFWKLRVPVQQPEILGLFAATIPPETLPDSESRVEKVIGNDGQA